MFSFSRLHGADPMLGVEMASTGEVGCLAGSFPDALLLSLLSTGFRVPRHGVLLSLGPKAEKFVFADEVLVIRDELRLPIYATAGTAAMLHELAKDCHLVGETEHDADSVDRAIEEGETDVVINVPRTYDIQGRPDGFRIRRAAIVHSIPLVTDPQRARTVIEALRRTGGCSRLPLPMDHYPASGPRSP